MLFFFKCLPKWVFFEGRQSSGLLVGWTFRLPCHDTLDVFENCRVCSTAACEKQWGISPRDRRPREGLNCRWLFGWLEDEEGTFPRIEQTNSVTVVVHGHPPSWILLPRQFRSAIWKLPAQLWFWTFLLEREPLFWQHKQRMRSQNGWLA